MLLVCDLATFLLASEVPQKMAYGFDLNWRGSRRGCSDENLLMASCWRTCSSWRRVKLLFTFPRDRPACASIPVLARASGLSSNPLWLSRRISMRKKFADAVVLTAAVAALCFLG